ncbi:MAG: hypothetical protein KDA78_15240 [Planctomycetaceae bacterium]|nr:hypothetical protein [Planctomycetaceae bacterium]
MSKKVVGICALLLMMLACDTSFACGRHRRARRCYRPTRCYVRVCQPTCCYRVIHHHCQPHQEGVQNPQHENGEAENNQGAEGSYENQK